MRWLVLVTLLLSGVAQGQSLGVTLHAGSIGPGAEVSTRLGERWQLRVSGSFLEMRADRRLHRGGLEANLDGTLAAGVAGLTLDFIAIPGLRLSAGLWTLLGQGESSLAPGPSMLGGVLLSAEELGQIDVRTSVPDRPAPFVGIGLGGTGSRRITPVLDVGILFQGRPDFHVKATGLLTATDAWERELMDAFRRASWYPVATVGIRVRIDAPNH